MFWLKKARDMLLKKEQRIIIWAVLSFLILTFLLAFNFFPDRFKMEAGDVARFDLEASQTMTIIDKEKTAAKQQQALAEVDDIYKIEQEVNQSIQRELALFFDYFLFENQLDLEEKIMAINEITLEQVSRDDVLYLASLSKAEIEELEEKTVSLFNAYLQQGIAVDEFPAIKRQLENQILQTIQSTELQNILLLLKNALLRPNLTLDQAAIATEKDRIKAEVEPVEKTIQRGEILVRRGQVITAEDIELIKQLGMLRPDLTFFSFLGIAILVFFIFGISAFYLKSYHPSLVKDELTVVFLSFMPIFMLLIAVVVSSLKAIDNIYLIPVAAGSILIAVLIDSKVALQLTPILVIINLLVVGGGINHFVVALIGSVGGVYSVSKVSQRSDFVRAGFIVGLISAIGIIGFAVAENITDGINILQLGSLGLLNGVFVAVLVNGILPLLENYMGLTSSVKLLELSNPNQPLLKKLLMEAPGTYHHSIIVGNLVESAAENLGADALLGRVGAYYHDVGKIKRPYFFAENLLGASNPHKKLNNSLSALIIKSHVKDGVELAKKYRVPTPIVDIIKQHHGTSLISYFYQNAIQQQGADAVDEETFSYDGPKPRTKEAALVLLADVVEAAVRSRSDDRSNPLLLEGLIHDLIQEKLASGQLDDCDLTLRDLDPIKEAFYKVLMGIYHKRIDYPESAEVKEGEIDVNKDFDY